MIDANGRVLHEWHMIREEVWPDMESFDKNCANQYFRRIRLLEDGDLLAIYEYIGIIKLDAQSNLLWSHQGWNHHDIDVDERGRIYILGRDVDYEGKQSLELTEKPFVQKTVAGKWIYDENITVLSPNGIVLEIISIVDCIKSSRFAPLLDAVWTIPRSDKPIDLLHPNTLQILDGKSAHLSPAFSKGNILTSFRNISTIAIIDPIKKKVVWALSRAWRCQHDPVLLDTGLMLLFDNHVATIYPMKKDRYSQVIEFNPLTQQKTWSYSGTDRNPFFSSLMGAVQRLPNDNILITESDFGRAFEITRDKKIVWEFKSPHTTGDQNEFVANIPDLHRIPVDAARGFADAP